MACWGYANKEHGLYEIFGNEPIPLQSLIPMIPREPGSPACFIVLCDRIPQFFKYQLAELLFKKWEDEAGSIQEVLEYIEEGLPVQCTFFRDVASNERAEMNAYISFLVLANQSDIDRN